MIIDHTPPTGLFSNDVIPRMAARGVRDVTTAGVRMTASHDTSRSVSGHSASPLVAALSSTTASDTVPVIERRTEASTPGRISCPLFGRSRPAVPTSSFPLSSAAVPLTASGVEPAPSIGITDDMIKRGRGGSFAF